MSGKVQQMMASKIKAAFEPVVLKRFFCAKDLRECLARECAYRAVLRGSSSKRLAKALKLEAWREILWPKTGRRMTAFAFAMAAFFVLAALSLAAQSNAGLQPGTGVVSTQRPQILQQVGIDQHLNQQLPLDLHFRDEAGKDVRLGDFFNRRPVILSLVYFRCPMLCGEVLNGLTSAISVVSFDLGRDYDIVTVSIDPRETPADAGKMKEVYLRRYNRHSDGSSRQGWHFLTGSEDQIKKLAGAVGFRYVYDPRIDQYAHASGIEVLTPEGRIAQYYYGIEYSPKDLRLGLIEASKNHIGNLVDSVLLYCYHYDPATGRYGAMIMRILRLAGIATVLLLGGFIFTMVRRDVRAGRLDPGRAA